MVTIAEIVNSTELKVSNGSVPECRNQPVSGSVNNNWTHGLTPINYIIYDVIMGSSSTPLSVERIEKWVDWLHTSRFRIAVSLVGNVSRRAMYHTTIVSIAYMTRRVT